MIMEKNSNDKKKKKKKNDTHTFLNKNALPVAPLNLLLEG